MPSMLFPLKWNTIKLETQKWKKSKIFFLREAVLKMLYNKQNGCYFKIVILDKDHEVQNSKPEFKFGAIKNGILEYPQNL